MNMGSRLWIISEERSINILTKPNAQTPAGILPTAPFLLSVLKKDIPDSNALEECDSGESEQGHAE